MRIIFLCVILLISVATAESLVAYTLQSVNIPLEVKEPLAILQYPSGFSLFPGETEDFNVTIQNLASINYSIKLGFILSNAEYQSKYVTFSNKNYVINPGTQTLAAWLKVSTAAPAGNFSLTATLLREEEQTTPSPPPTSSTFDLTLLGAGARWAAREGISVLYINYKDNWEAHHLTDGAGWGPWDTEEMMDNLQTEVATVLEQQGFNVTLKGDVPENISGYDLVVFEALWAVEPKHVPLVRQYLANGGGVVILGGVPTQFSVYCKDRWPYRFGGTDLSSFKDWFGAGLFANTRGYATLVVGNPFGTQLGNSTIVYSGEGSEKAVTMLDNNAQIIALWNDGYVFAFTHEYNTGRVYYQGEIKGLV